MRKLKFHEKKLLKKVDFLTWKREHGHRELQVRASTAEFGLCTLLGTEILLSCSGSQKVSYSRSRRVQEVQSALWHGD
jgi:hypothetical protein